MSVYTPPVFVCPITYDIMCDPVQCACGHNYERTAIERWYKDQQTCPVSGCIVPHKYLTPNIYLRNEILKWRTENNIPEPAPVPQSASIFVENTLGPSINGLLRQPLVTPPVGHVTRHPNGDLYMQSNGRTIRFVPNERVIPLPDGDLQVLPDGRNRFVPLHRIANRPRDEYHLSRRRNSDVDRMRIGGCLLKARYLEANERNSGYVDVKVIRDGCGVCDYCKVTGVTNNNNND